MERNAVRALGREIERLSKQDSAQAAFAHAVCIAQQRHIRALARKDRKVRSI